MTAAPAWIVIGVVGAPHGVRGEIRVKIETDFPQRFKKGTQLTLLVPPEWPKSPHGECVPRPFKVTQARINKGIALLKLDGIDSRDAAATLRGCDIVVRQGDVMPLPEGRWYIFELEGIDVFTLGGTRLGVLTEVLSPGGNDVYVVRDGNRETLLPAIRSVIVDVDVKARRMVVNPLEELQDDK